MLKYIGRRLLQMIPVFFGVTIVLFLMTAVIPTDPIQMLVGERKVPDELRRQLEEKYDLNKPVHIQYMNYINKLAHGDLGESYQKRRPVADMYRETLPNTFKLALVAIVLEILVGVVAGIISAIKRYTYADVLVTLSTSVLVAVPVFWLGRMMQLLFSLKFKEWGLPYLPLSGMQTDGFPQWMNLIMPAIVLAAISTAYAARIMRSQLLEVEGQDYIRTARAKGLAEKVVIGKHALKNALIPVVTYVGLDFGVLMGGAILTESVFNWPGIGSMIYFAVRRGDWPVVMGGVIIIVVIVMIVNLLVDVSYAFLDPRIRYGGEEGSHA